MNVNKRASREILINRLSFVQAVRCLLDTKSHWIKGTDAKAKSGLSVGARSPSAVCWCLVGAAECVRPAGGPGGAGNWFGSAESTQLAKLPDWASTSLVKFNDDPSTSHKDVLEALDNMAEGLAKQIDGVPA